MTGLGGLLLRVAGGVLLAAPLTLLAPGGPVRPATCAAASGQHHVALVVQHADGEPLDEVCVGFDSATITGEDVLRLSGVPYVTQSYGSYGDAVCRIDQEPNPYRGCFSGSGYWAMFVSRGGGAWTMSDLGVSSQTFADGDAEGFRFDPQSGGGSGDPPPPPIGICPPPGSSTPVASAAPDGGPGTSGTAAAAGTSATTSASAARGATAPAAGSTAAAGVPGSTGTVPTTPPAAGGTSTAAAGPAGGAATPAAGVKGARVGGALSAGGTAAAVATPAGVSVGAVIAFAGLGGLAALLVLRLRGARRR